MIKKLNLDIYVEDNWDIVNHLNVEIKNQKSKIKIFWIFNLLDRNIKYKNKFSSLKSVILSLSKDLKL